QLRQEQAISLATTEIADTLLLIATTEIEARQVRTRLRLVIADHDQVLTFADLFPDGLRVVEFAHLADIAQLHRVAETYLARVWLFLAGDDLEQGRLARAVAAHDTDNAAGGNFEAEILEQHLVFEALADVLRFDDYVSKTRPRWDVDFVRLVPA